jgi:predicted O-methyltransferase YrrM
MEEVWSQVDAYFAGQIVDADDALERALVDSAAAGLPAIAVSPVAGKLLHLIVKLRGAKRILEIGTLGGYSAIWMARALPMGGAVVSLELNPDNAAVARRNVDRAGVGSRVEILVGPAATTIEDRLVGKVEPFDMVFIDADKSNNDVYFRGALKLTRPGSIIVVDNVVRKGAVLDEDSDDANVQGIRRMVATVAAEPRVSATAIQTVGSKGYDGFLFALVVG